MTDITTRLRRWTHDAHAVPASDLMDEAAGEIDRLRSRLRLQDAVIRSGAVAVLTDAELEAVETAALEADARQHAGRAAALRGLLDRLGPVLTPTPPSTAAAEGVEK